MSRLPKVRIHEFVDLSDKVKALLAVTECEATWSFTTGAWLVYEKQDPFNLVGPYHPLWARQYDVVFAGDGTPYAQWQSWLRAISRVKQPPDNCHTKDDRERPRG